MSPTHGGDLLARGGARADFGMAGVDEEKWRLAFGEEGLKKLNAMDEKDRNKLVEEAKAQVEAIIEAQKPKPVKFRAVLDRIVVTRFEEAEKINGLYVPDEGKEKPSKGIVVAVGPGKFVDGALQKPSIEVGEKVAFGKFAGAEIQIGSEHYLVIREEDVFVVEE